MGKNYLTRKESRVVEDLILEKGEEIEEGKWTQQALADIATRKLGRPVTVGNVRGSAIAMSISFPRVSKPGITNAELRAIITLLVRELVQLRGELGTPCSPTLLALAEKEENNEKDK